MKKNEGMLYWDVGDIVHYLRYHKTPTGIQRVQIELIKRALNDTTLNHKLFFVWYDADNVDKFYRVSRNNLKSLISLTDGVEHDTKSIYGRIDDDRKQPIIGPGDTLFITGSFWVTEDYERLVYRTKLDGAKIGLYIYDLIPLELKEFCMIELCDKFETILERLVYVVDFYFTISNYVGQSLEDYLKSFNLEVPVRTVQLAHSFGSEKSLEESTSRRKPKRLKDNTVDKLRWIRGQKFCLFPSTVESRKNVEFAFNVWKQLLNKYDHSEVPILVFSGRTGWLVENVLYKIEAWDGFDGKIQLLGGVSDDDLHYLYKNAEFTLFPSYGEGWGLPVGESLSFGTPCVASNNTSIPEVGGKFVAYVDPYDSTSGFKIIDDLLFDGVTLNNLRHLIQDEFQGRSWNDVFKDFKNMLNESSEFRIMHSSNLPKVPVNDTYYFNKNSKNKFSHNVYKYGWAMPEGFGAWSVNESSELLLDIDIKEYNKIYALRLEFAIPPWYPEYLLDVFICGVPYKDIRITPFDTSVSLMVGKSSWGQFKDANGSLEISFSSKTPLSSGNDHRKLGLGIVSTQLADDMLHDENIKYPSLPTPCSTGNVVSAENSDFLEFLGDWSGLEPWGGVWSLERKAEIMFSVEEDCIGKECQLNMMLAIPAWYEGEVIEISCDEKIVGEYCFEKAKEEAVCVSVTPERTLNRLKFEFKRTILGADQRSLHLGFRSLSIDTSK